MTKDEAIKIVDDYNRLLGRALEITDNTPFYSSVDGDDNASLSFDGDDVVLSWKEYQSDYYGGGYLDDETFKFPIDILLMDDKDFTALCKKVVAEEEERNARLRAAQAAVERDRREAHERAVYAQLKAKFERS